MSIRDIINLYKKAREKLLANDVAEARRGFNGVIDGLQDVTAAASEKIKLRVWAENGLIDTCIRLEKYSEANERVQKAMEQFGRQPPLLIQSGRLHLLNKQLKAAMKEFASGIKSVPADGEAAALRLDLYLGIVETLMAMHKYGKAWNIYSGLSDKDACQADRIREKIIYMGRKTVEEYSSSGEWDNAWKTCGALLRCDSGNPVFQIMAGRICVGQKKFHRAREYFKKGLTQLSRSNENESLWLKEKAYEGMVELSFAEKDIHLMVESARLILSLKQRGMTHHVLNIIYHLRISNQLEDAYKLCLEVLAQINGNNTPGNDNKDEKLVLRTNIELAYIMFVRGDLERAAFYASSTLSLSPGQSDAHKILAEVHLLEGNFEKACYHISVTIETLKNEKPAKSKDIYDCYTRLGEFRARQCDHEGAIQCYRNMIALVYCEDGDAGALDIDALYEKIEKHISSVRTGSKVYMNPDLMEIHRRNPQGYLNEIYGTVEMIRNTKIVKTKPVDMVVSITGRCNLNCVMCGNDESKKWNIPRKAVEEIKSLFPYMRSIQWRGGEAFLSPYFEDLVKAALKYPHLKQSINTNGLLLTRKWAKRFVEGNFDIVFSIDGIRKESYEAIRRGATYRKLLDSLTMIKNMRKEKGSNSIVSMTFVVMKGNYRDIPALVSFAKKHGINEIRLSKLVPFGSHGFNELDTISDPVIYDEVRRYIRKIAVDAMENNITFHNWFEDLEINKTINTTGRNSEIKPVAIESAPRSGAAGRICIAPWKNIFINTGGNVYVHCFCNVKLGNLSAESLMGLWNGTVIRSLRKINPACIPNKLSRCHELIV